MPSPLATAPGTAPGTATTAPVFCGMPRLRELHLSGVFPSEVDLTVAGIRALDQLTHLDVSHCPSMGVRGLSQLTSLSTLQALHARRGGETEPTCATRAVVLWVCTWLAWHPSFPSLDLIRTAGPQRPLSHTSLAQELWTLWQRGPRAGQKPRPEGAGNLWTDELQVSGRGGGGARRRLCIPPEAHEAAGDGPCITTPRASPRATWHACFILACEKRA